MARIGTKKKPAVVRVQTEARAHETLEYCRQHDIVAIVGVEPDKEEDISDIARALGAPEPAPATRNAVEKIGRNDPCPCGSGKKFKKCCAGLPAAG